MSERTQHDVATTEYILPLADPRATLETVGGKGASLARLAAPGCRCRMVSTSPRRPTALCGRERPATGHPGRVGEGGRGSPRDVGGGLGEHRRAVCRGAVPPDIAAAIATAYAALSGRDPIVAVRSSATAEDLPEACFAGQQETYLNLRGYDPVLRAVVTLLGQPVDGAGHRLPGQADRGAWRG